VDEIKAFQSHKNVWNRKRILGLATAIIITIALPISIDHGYFRYSVYALPCLGLCAAILYVTSILTIPAVRGYGHQVLAINRAAGIALLGVLLAILLGGMGLSFRLALNISKLHVEEAHNADVRAARTDAPPPASTAPETATVTEAQSAAMPPREQSLSESALGLAANIRTLSENWEMEQQKIDNANDVTEYDDKYRADAQITHERLLHHLPPETDSLAMRDDYTNEINPTLLSVIANDLERLAKLLPKPATNVLPKAGVKLKVRND
jgi:hypothetical protein